MRFTCTVTVLLYSVIQVAPTLSSPLFDQNAVVQSFKRSEIGSQSGRFQIDPSDALSSPRVESSQSREAVTKKGKGQSKLEDESKAALERAELKKLRHREHSRKSRAKQKGIIILGADESSEEIRRAAMERVYSETKSFLHHPRIPNYQPAQNKQAEGAVDGVRGIESKKNFHIDLNEPHSIDLNESPVQVFYRE